jgi:hypothetical protein
MEGQILSSTEHVKVDEAIGALLDVAVEDGRIGVQAQFVGDAMHIKPDIAANLALIRLIMHAIIKDLRATPWQ